MILPPTFTGRQLNVIIETPKGSNNKYVYEPDYDLFRIKKNLPQGFVFPLDFGFIPNTVGGDGDPLDILVIMDTPGYPGCLVSCNLIGVINVLQTKQGKHSERNDRYIAVASRSTFAPRYKTMQDLGAKYIEQLIGFFQYYMESEGTKFQLIDTKGKAEALKQIKSAQVGEL